MAYREDLSGFRFIEEQEGDRHQKIVVTRNGDSIELSTVSVSMNQEIKREFFEKGWGAYLIREG